jgi:hypothetical protein
MANLQLPKVKNDCGAQSDRDKTSTVTAVPKAVVKGTTSYSFETLHEEVAKDVVWKLEFGYLPKVTTANLRFYQIRRSQHLATSEAQLEKKLLVGTYQDQQKSPVYAHVYRSRAGHWNLVDIHHENEAQTERIRLTTDRHVDAKIFEPLKNMTFVEPFHQLKRIGGGPWRNEFRFLTLFYFLEKGLLKQASLSSGGLDSLRKACSAISGPSICNAKKPTRSWPRSNKTTAPSEPTKVQKSDNTRPQDDEETLFMKEEPSPVAVPVTAPENSSTRAVTTMILRGNAAARLLAKTSDKTEKPTRLVFTAKPHTRVSDRVPAAAPSPVPELKRKRSTEDQASEREGGQVLVSHNLRNL